MTRLGFQHCNGCNRDLPVWEFYRSRRTGRVESRCKGCRRTAARESNIKVKTTTGIQG